MWNHEQFGVWSLAWKPESILALLAGVWIGAPSVSTWCSLSWVAALLGVLPFFGVLSRGHGRGALDKRQTNMR